MGDPLVTVLNKIGAGLGILTDRVLFTDQIYLVIKQI